MTLDMQSIHAAMRQPLWNQQYNVDSQLLKTTVGVGDTHRRPEMRHPRCKTSPMLIRAFQRYLKKTKNHLAQYVLSPCSFHQGMGEKGQNGPSGHALKYTSQRSTWMFQLSSCAITTSPNGTKILGWHITVAPHEFQCAFSRRFLQRLRCLSRCLSHSGWKSRRNTVPTCRAGAQLRE